MKRILSILFLLTLFAIASFAEIPNRPYPPRLVNDFAGVLANNENAQLEETLEKFARETSTQIVVVTVGYLEGYDSGDYAVRLGEKWGVGQKDKDNGIIILLKPKQDNSKGEIFIATGYGLEGVLPDAVVNGAIIDKEMIPYFMENNYYKGLTSGIKVIMDISRGEYSAAEYQEYYAKESNGIVPAIVIILLIFVVFPILRGRRQRFYSPGKSLPFWIAMGMLSGKNANRGSFGNFSSGRGGFGGFGGGSFGGGGAGGSW